MSSRFEFRVVVSATISGQKRRSVRLKSHLLCYVHVLFINLYLFTHTGIHARWCSCRLTVTQWLSLVELLLLTLPEHMGSPPVFSEVRVTRFLVLCVMFGRSLFVHLSFLFWPLCCQFFFDLLILITPFVIFKLFYLHVQSVHITTNVLNSNPLIGRFTRINIVWYSLSVSCDRSVVLFSVVSFTN